MIKDWSRIEIMKEKIGIISDTHGLLRPEVLEILKDCKYILHAGDVNKDEILDVLRSMGNLYVVRGNNDKDWAENFLWFITKKTLRGSWGTHRWSSSGILTNILRR